MTRNKKKQKIVKLLFNLIKHDFGFYNPIWDWNALPNEIKDNYVMIEDILNQWQSKGFIKIYMVGEKRVIEIIAVPEGNSF